ncbi:CoA-acylating methylmalonate-semialdehyde dehydrogenase [Agriterribacter sp.]|uniref:CoA-acylating methylmalonate-semialdehyde dehydrogenase n=1 Tax=Agriterribacter sp. TaxID=2821509 RepID=UPI002D0E8571|nr:CoA-acylating methylmalonate-semialdehyde dehydrogenase [Agriterribacter sp.]HRO44741.1 CoA-acylating methylmalonate-semialdehyde dehydrogenase [Agriterribacter sp.]HRQ16414.1 CoA-acylating methylmalonate-semialdehyde dehydrogenase [Agriterribacter sp.]
MEKLRNYINGQWVSSSATTYVNVVNPASQEVLAQVPSGTPADVDAAVQSSENAFATWKRVPAGKRIQYLFHLKRLLEENMDELSKTITLESGKTYAESKAEWVRAIENVENACGIPALMQGDFSEDISLGIDEYMIRQPLGVCACISPFNFPGMIPFWFLPYAIACGNSFLIKPSEKVPLTMTKVMELIAKLDLPAGVINMVHGGKAVVDGILEHPGIKAVSFVGSSAIARYVYAKGAVNGKRMQAQGGAKNPVIILPDADIDMTTQIVVDSVYGCAGQRCLAASTIITVGEHANITESLVELSRQRTTGFGLDEAVQMGPVITADSKTRVNSLIEKGIQEGGRLLLDGRNAAIPGYEKGNFIQPTIIEDIPLHGEIAGTEIFGPVMSLVHINSIEEAIAYVNSNKYGNMACIFTSSGLHARRFRNEADAGNIGINIGVAAPVAQFPFSGWKESFFGDLHGQGKHAVEFFTQTKVVIERWLKEWTRKF